MMAKMEALVFHGPGGVGFEMVTKPSLRSDYVLLRVHGCGICGTDMHVYGGMPAPWPVPGVRGHEISGVIEQLGDKVDGLKVGARVVVQPLVFCGTCPACQRGETNLCSKAFLIGGEVAGGFAQFVAVPASTVFQVPDGLPLEHAALAETLATPLHALQMHIHKNLHSVAIIGAGAQGLLSLQLIRNLGVPNIVVSDVVPQRLTLASELGATQIVNAREQNPVDVALEMSHKEGVDLVIDAAGLAVNRQQTIEMLRAGGTGIFLALGPGFAEIEFGRLVPRELHLHGTQCYTNKDFTHAIELLAKGDIAAQALVDTLPLSQGPQAFQTLAANPTEHIKIVLEPA